MDASSAKNFFHVTHFSPYLALNLVSPTFVFHLLIVGEFSGGLLDFASNLFGSAHCMILRTLFHESNLKFREKFSIRSLADCPSGFPLAKCGHGPIALH